MIRVNLKFNLINVFVVLLLACGCVSTATRGTARVHALIKAKSNNEIVNSKSDAKETLLTLRDDSIWPGVLIDDVEVGDHSVNMAGPLTRSEWGNAYVGLYTNSAWSYVHSTTSRNNRIIWFKDITRIELFRTKSFNYFWNKEEFEENGTIYSCLLKLSDGKLLEFGTENEAFAKRLASAFSYFSKISISPTLSYPADGYFFDPDSAIVTDVLEGGPFEKGGGWIALEILSVNQNEAMELEEISQALESVGEESYYVMARSRKVDSAPFRVEVFLKSSSRKQVPKDIIPGE